MNIKWPNIVSYKDLLEKIRNKNIPIVNIETTIRSKVLLYFGHLTRMNDWRMAKMMMYACMDGGANTAGGQEMS